MSEKVRLSTLVEIPLNPDYYFPHGLESVTITIQDILREASQLNSFEDLIGYTIEHVEYQGEDILLTIERRE